MKTEFQPKFCGINETGTTTVHKAWCILYFNMNYSSENQREVQYKHF